MIRSLGLILSACCIATLLSQVIGLSILWFRGQLTADTVRDIRAVLSGQDQDSVAADDEMQKDDVSREDVVRDRSMRILSLNSLQNELSILKSMVDSRKTSLLAEQKAFLKQKDDFEKALVQIDAERTSVAAEQARGVLMALAPADAVTTLMRLTLEENVMLLKEMPEKKIAGLLKQFSEGNDPARITRGQEIFEAISRGEPARTLIHETAARLKEPGGAELAPGDRAGSRLVPPP